MGTDEYVIRPLTTDTWEAFAAMVERHNGIFGGCWCIAFHPDCAERGGGYDGNRALKKKLVERGAAHAALVMIGDEAVAWAEYGTPEELPNIHHRKQYLAEADLEPDFRITCIFVDKRHRRSGFAKVALDGALELIAAAGGGVVEGYPHEIGEQRMNNSFVYNGTRTMYEEAGFEFVRAKGMKTPSCGGRSTPPDAAGVSALVVHGALDGAGALVNIQCTRASGAGRCRTPQPASLPLYRTYMWR